MVQPTKDCLDSDATCGGYLAHPFGFLIQNAFNWALVLLLLHDFIALSWLLGSSVRVCIVKSTKPSTILCFPYSDLPFAEHPMMVPSFSIDH